MEKYNLSLPFEVELKNELIDEGHRFYSKTDSEVIVHLIEKYMDKNMDLEHALRKTTQHLEGSYAIAAISKNEPGKIVATKNDSPLNVAQGDEGYFVTSDVPGTIEYARNVIRLKDDEIAILDEGIGIFKSLSQNRIHRNYINSNDEALKWAIKPGVSVAFDPSKGNNSNDTWANSGYGLFMISEICKLTTGRFTLVSGDDCLRVFSNAIGNYGVHFNGTALGIRVGTTNIGKCQAIIDSARSNGEETAKNIKNAFKEASVPSRGLIY